MHWSWIWRRKWVLTQIKNHWLQTGITAWVPKWLEWVWSLPSNLWQSVLWHAAKTCLSDLSDLPFALDSFCCLPLEPFWNAFPLWYCLDKAIRWEMMVFWPSGNTAGISKHVELQWDVLRFQIWPSTASLTWLWWMWTFLATLGCFPNQQRDVDMYLPGFGNLENIQKRQAETGNLRLLWMCFASRKSTTVNSFFDWNEMNESAYSWPEIRFGFSDDARHHHWGRAEAGIRFVSFHVFHHETQF